MTGTLHLLSFERLSPADFERLCLWLIRREGYSHVEHVGLSGMDRGCDIVAWRDGRRIGFQCKRSSRFGPTAAEAAVVKALDSPWHLTELILIVACPVSAGARAQARIKAGSIPCQIWGLSELDERVNRYPDLVRYFFLSERFLAYHTSGEPSRDNVAAVIPMLLAYVGLYLVHMQVLLLKKPKNS